MSTTYVSIEMPCGPMWPMDGWFSVAVVSDYMLNGNVMLPFDVIAVDSIVLFVESHVPILLRC